MEPIKIKMIKHTPITRKSFIGQLSCAACGITGMVSAFSQLKALGAIAADTSDVRNNSISSDYKALVCIYLRGGNDGGNTLVPIDNSSYKSYAQARAEVALSQSSLLAIKPKTFNDGRSYGLHPNIPELQSLFNKGNLAILANVGTLLAPTNLSSYMAGSSLPLQLYSHLDQSNQWQSSISDQPIIPTGWGGRLGDLMNSANSNAKISMQLSLNGSNLFQTGQNVIPYSIYNGGAQVLNGYWENNSGYQTIKTIFGTPSSNIIANTFSQTSAKSVSDSEFMVNVLNAAPNLKTNFPNSNIGRDLQMVAKLISVADSLGLKRQTFFISHDGYDCHGSLLQTHQGLLTDLSSAMNAFNNATIELGVSSQVTTFTASDFGRTYAPNSGGTDHAWGNLQFIMGGAVKGGDIYGTMPSLNLGGPDDTGRGRWIPSTSIDQYNATLAKWFGVSSTNMSTVIPNIDRFSNQNLGFLM
jgi:uncharacterized protein (DUF1501 family)